MNPNRRRWNYAQENEYYWPSVETIKHGHRNLQWHMAHW